jgi:hypothetical protein
VARVPSLRASDADREQVAERLRHATAEGRLSPEELEDRLGVLFATRTYDELDVLTADLPVARSAVAVPRARFPAWALPAGAAALLLTVFGMLAAAAPHPEVVTADRGRHDQFGLTGPLGDPHHALVAAGASLGVIAALVVCAAVLCLWMRARPAADA